MKNWLAWAIGGGIFVFHFIAWGHPSTNGGDLSPDSPSEKVIRYAGFVHLVEAGDSIQMICRMYGVLAEELLVLNRLPENSAQIRPGMKLKIPAEKFPLD